MKKLRHLLPFVLLGVSAFGAELPISSKLPLMVTAPEGWKSARDESAMAKAMPFETFQITPPAGRNAAILFSAIANDNAMVANPAALKTILRADCRPYTQDVSKVEPKELKVNGGLGFYTNFVDPDLVGKPTKSGEFKTATPMIIALGAKHFVKATILCDDLNGADYREAFQIVESLKAR